MGELINLKRAKKAALRAEKERVAAANRIKHGTPKQLRKAVNAEKERMMRTTESHKLNPKEP